MFAIKILFRLNHQLSYILTLSLLDLLPHQCSYLLVYTSSSYLTLRLPSISSRPGLIAILTISYLYRKMRPLSLKTGSSGDGAMPSDALEPIAIIGLATHFPKQATTTEGLWELLLQARSTWSSIPKERFNSDAFYHPDPEHGGTVSHTRAMTDQHQHE